MKKTTTRTAIIYMDENSVLHIEMLEGALVDYEDAVDNLLVVKSYTKGKMALKLIDARADFRIDKRARELINSVDAKQTIARAVVKGSAITRVLFSFFVGLNKPKTPTKIFSDYDEAYKWLVRPMRGNVFAVYFSLGLETMSTEILITKLTAF